VPGGKPAFVAREVFFFAMVLFFVSGKRKNIVFKKMKDTAASGEYKCY